MPPPSKNPPARTGQTGQTPRARTGQTGSLAASRPRRAAAPRPAARLVCTAGPASGQEFPLSGDEITIGRAADATVSVPDTSVSRKHALVRKTDEGWAISDLGSGNGTLVNGEQLGDEQALNAGDTIVLGDTEFTFADGSEASQVDEPSSLSTGARRPPVRTARTTGAAPGRNRPVRGGRSLEDPASAKKKKRTLFIVAGSTLAVVMALFVGYKAITKRREEDAARKRAVIEANRRELATAFQEAKNLTKEGKWVEARTRLEQIVEFDPEFEKRSVANYLERANTEIPNEQALAEAKQALADDQLGKAAAALGRVKNTMMEKRVTELSEALTQKVADKVLEARKKFTGAPRDLAVLEQVKAMAEDVLAAQPENREAPDVKRQADDAIFRIKNPSAPVAIPETPHLEVQQRFRAGDLSGAMSLAQACAARTPQCRTLEGQMRDFDTRNKNLENLSSAELRGLYQLDKRIAGGTSSDLSKQLRVRLATVSYKEASNAKTVRDWVLATEKAKLVLEVDPGHPGATQLLSEARQQAHEIYLRGYQLRETSPDEAAKLFKEVIQMTPADDTDHQKAKSRLEELQRQ